VNAVTTMKTSLRTTVILAAAGASLAACAPADSAGVSEEQADILNGTPTSDPVGYAYLNNGASCSGTFLSPQWVLTAGHCLMKKPSAQVLPNPPMDTVYLGNQTTGALSGPGYVNPGWWDPTAQVSQQFPYDAAHDVALVRTNTPFSTSGYSDSLFNVFSNRTPFRGETLTCYGYGLTTTSGGGGGGGVGHLAKANLQIYDPNATYPPGLLAEAGEQQTFAMVELIGNSQGQQLYYSDSGSSCADAAIAPNQIMGVTDLLDPSTNPLTSYLVQPAAVRQWVDQNMHSSAQPLAVPPLGAATFTSAISSPSNNGNSIFVVAGYTGSQQSGNRIYMMAYSANSGWSGWAPVSMTGLPAGGIASRVALSATSFSPGFVQLVMAVIGADQQMYVAPLVPFTGPNANWTSLHWAPAGGLFPAGTQPAIGFNGSRVDVFGIGTTWRLYQRSQTNWGSSAWTSNWNQVPSSITFSEGVSVTFNNGSYYLVSTSDGGAGMPNTGNNGWVATFGVTGASGGSWSAWTPIGGAFESPPAITSFLGGVTVYGLSYDNNLYRGTHNLTDSLATWSGWMNLAKGVFVQPEGVSVDTSYGQAGQIRIVTTDANRNPMLVTYPW
jgi:hypothetical protein